MHLSSGDLADLRLEHVELRARLFRRHADAKPADRLVVVVASPTDTLGVHVNRHEGVGHRRQPRSRQLKVRPQNADDGMRPAVKRQDPSDDVRIGSETLTPVGVGDDRHLRTSARVVRRHECSAERGLRLQHVEDRAAHAPDGDLRRVADAGEVGGQHDVLSHRLERSRVLAPVFEVPFVDLQRGHAIRELPPDLTHRDQALRLAVGQRLEQHAVDDRKHGRGRADGERQREHYRQAVSAVAAEAADGVAKIKQEGAHEPLDGPGSAAVDRRDSAGQEKTAEIAKHAEKSYLRGLRGFFLLVPQCFDRIEP